VLEILMTVDEIAFGRLQHRLRRYGADRKEFVAVVYRELQERDNIVTSIGYHDRSASYYRVADRKRAQAEIDAWRFPPIVAHDRSRPSGLAGVVGA
jgi:hypothetical protein